MRKAVVSVVVAALAATLVVSTPSLSQSTGKRKKQPKAYEYGNVYLQGDLGEGRDEAPVLFRHWVHRSQFTCRICHVELGIAMQAGETDILKEDVVDGYYCGACHTGQIAFSLNGCDPANRDENCAKCHFAEGKRALRKKFKETFAGFPRTNFGNKIDWEVAEDRGLIKLVNFIEGVSLKSKTIKPPVDFEKKAEVIEMPSIIFSHDKHNSWSGCEACHPDIFEAKMNATTFTMQHNFDGLYCGSCHGKVAFPTYDCQLCHTTLVQ